MRVKNNTSKFGELNIYSFIQGHEFIEKTQEFYDILKIELFNDVVDDSKLKKISLITFMRNI